MAIRRRNISKSVVKKWVKEDEKGKRYSIIKIVIVKYLCHIYNEKVTYE